MAKEEQSPAKIAPIVSGPKAPDAKAPAGQSGVDILQALLDEIRRSNKPVDNIQLPGKAEVKPIDGAATDSKTAPDGAAKAAARSSGGAVIASPSDVVTNAILNQGQLIQSNGAASKATNTGIDAKLSDVLATLDKVSKQADEGAKKKDSGGGFLGTILSIGSKIFGFL